MKEESKNTPSSSFPHGRPPSHGARLRSEDLLTDETLVFNLERTLTDYFNIWKWPEYIRICQRRGQRNGGELPGTGKEVKLISECIMLPAQGRASYPGVGGDPRDAANGGRGREDPLEGGQELLPWDLSFHSSSTSSPQPLLTPNEAKGEKSAFYIFLIAISRNYRKSA